MSAERLAYWGIRLLSVGTFLACFVAVCSLLIAMATYAIIKPHLPEDTKVWTDLRCMAGMPIEGDDTCLAAALQRQNTAHAEKMTVLQQRIASVQAEKARIERAITDEDISFTESNYIKDDGSLVPDPDSSQGMHHGRKVVVGVVRNGQSIDQGWCWSTRDVFGIDIRITIARLKPDGSINPATPSAAALEKVNWKPGDLPMLRGHCPWPRGVN